MVWVDLETTGLDPLKDWLLEVGMVVTNTNLEILDSMCWLFNDFDEPMSVMVDEFDDFIKDMHTKSGLINDLLTKSSFGRKESTDLALEFLDRFKFSERPPMCGNNIPFDRAFLKENLPQVENFFHYRNLDVSSIKNAYKVEVENYCRYIEPGMTVSEGDFPQWESPTAAHRSIDDIKVSIAEYKFYREHLFR